MQIVKICMLLLLSLALSAQADGHKGDQALLEGFLLTGNSIYFDHAQEIAKSIERICPYEGAFRVYTPSFEAAWQKQLEIEDNVIPSANSMWAHFFQSLGVKIFY